MQNLERTVVQQVSAAAIDEEETGQGGAQLRFDLGTPERLGDFLVGAAARFQGFHDGIEELSTGSLPVAEDAAEDDDIGVTGTEFAPFLPQEFLDLDALLLDEVSSWHGDEAAKLVAGELFLQQTALAYGTIQVGPETRGILLHGDRPDRSDGAAFAALFAFDEEVGVAALAPVLEQCGLVDQADALQAFAGGDVLQEKARKRRGHAAIAVTEFPVVKPAAAGTLYPRVVARLGITHQRRQVSDSSFALSGYSSKPTTFAPGSNRAARPPPVKLYPWGMSALNFVM